MPLTMAPTGLIKSWQTREHNSAARSRAPSASVAGSGERTWVAPRRPKAARACHRIADSATVTRPMKKI